MGGIISENCECIGELPFDCPELWGNVGDPCETPNVPWGGIISENCDCIGNSPQFDCPELEANIGESCFDFDSSGNFIMGTVTENCDCDFGGLELPDCPDLGGNIGEPCETPNLPLGGVISGNCECVSNSPFEFDCPDLQLNLGDTCTIYFGNQVYYGLVYEGCICD